MSSVYFIECAKAGAIKIGVSTNVPSRLASLQTSNAHPLVVLLELPGDLALEHRLHYRFSKERLSGEWFKNDGELHALLVEIAGPGFSDDEQRLVRIEQVLVFDPYEEWRSRRTPEDPSEWERMRDAWFAVIRTQGLPVVAAALTRIWGPQGRPVTEKLLLGCLIGKNHLRLEWLPWFSSQSRDCREAEIRMHGDAGREYVDLCRSLRAEIGDADGNALIERAERRGLQHR